MNTGVFETPRKFEEPVFRSSLAMDRDTGASALHLAIMSTEEGAAKRKKAANNFALFNQFNYMTEKQYEKANNRLIFQERKRHLKKEKIVSMELLEQPKEAEPEKKKEKKKK